MTNIALSTTIQDLELTLARHKSVLDKFPDAKIHSYGGYSSRTVNKCYTQYSFISEYSGLYVLPYCEIEFSYQGQEELIKVSSQPTRNRLAYISWHTVANGKRIMKFARFAINQKNNEFKDEMLNNCKAEIMKFIKDNPGCSIDDKHLEPRLKKLILFT